MHVVLIIIAYIFTDMHAYGSVEALLLVCMVCSAIWQLHTYSTVL